jgi:hypothetical protein
MMNQHALAFALRAEVKAAIPLVVVICRFPAPPVSNPIFDEPPEEHEREWGDNEGDEYQRS